MVFEQQVDQVVFCGTFQPDGFCHSVTANTDMRSLHTGSQCVLHCNSMTTTILKILHYVAPWHHNILYPSAFFPLCNSLIFCSKDSEPASSSKNNLKSKKKKSFKKIHNTSPTYLSLKMSCAVFSSFFLPTSFRGKSAFTLSRGA